MSFMESRKALIAVALAFVILVVGCGDGGETEPEFTDERATKYSGAVVDISLAAQADALVELGGGGGQAFNDAAYPFAAVDTILETLEGRCAEATVPDLATLDGD